MFVSETKVRVRYGETDQMGYMYHGNYAQFYEIGRVESLRQVGLSYKGIEEQGVMMPVLEIQSKFIKPALYDDEITIRTIMRELPSVRISFDFEMFNQHGELIHTATVKLVFVRSADMRPMRCPETLLEVYKPYFS